MAVRLRHGIFMAPFHKLDENPTLLFQQDMRLIGLLDGLGFHEAWIGERAARPHKGTECTFG